MIIRDRDQFGGKGKVRIKIIGVRGQFWGKDKVGLCN